MYRKFIPVLLIVLVISRSEVRAQSSHLDLSRKLVESVRDGKSTSKIQESLANCNEEALLNELDTDEKKKAFWMNVYNGYVQILLIAQPELFKDRDEFFGDERVNIAGKKLSFDQIEHGIIRGTKLKLGLGVVGDPFADNFVKDAQVEEEDGRIHFALNCGAKSCPPVAVYQAERLNEQLDISAKKYLKETTTYSKGVAHVTTLFSWFRGDFDGKDGIIRMLKRYEVIPQDSDPELKYNDYDWTLSTGNFQTL